MEQMTLLCDRYATPGVHVPATRLERNADARRPIGKGASVPEQACMSRNNVQRLCDNDMHKIKGS